MQTSPLWDEIRAEGRVEGRVEGRRETILDLGRHKFGKAPTKKQQKILEASTDLGQLQAVAARLLEVDSWAELLDDL
jgi:predicted transposase YdaD